MHSLASLPRQNKLQNKVCGASRNTTVATKSSLSWTLQEFGMSSIFQAVIAIATTQNK